MGHSEVLTGKFDLECWWCHRFSQVHKTEIYPAASKGRQLYKPPALKDLLV